MASASDGTPPPPPARRLGTGLYAGFIVGLVVAIGVVIGIIQNSQQVELKYLGWDLQTPLVVVLLVTILATVIVSAVVGLMWRHRRRRELGEREELRGLRQRQEAAAAQLAATQATATQKPEGPRSSPS